MTHLRSAAQDLVRGDQKHAEEEVQLVLAQRPEDYRALNLLGIIRAQQHRQEEAKALFEKVIRLKPDYAGAHVSLGLLYNEMGLLDNAVSELELALKMDRGREDAVGPLIELTRKQARAAVQEREFEKALSLLMKARKLNPNSSDVNYEFGMVALRMSLFEDARVAFEQVLTNRPSDANAIYALGRAEMGLAKISEAQSHFEKYVQLRPDDPTGHFGLGLILHMVDKTEEAHQQFERSIQLQPEQTESYVQLGFLDLEAGRIEEAATHFHSAMQRSSGNAGALLGLGRIEFQRKNYSSAAEYLTKALDADSSIREVHYYLGLTYARLGRMQESTEQFDIAGKLDREDLDRRRIILKLLDPSEVEAQQERKP